MRFRAAFLEKLPRLDDRYLHSRPTSDMTARGHAMHLMREAAGMSDMGGCLLGDTPGHVGHGRVPAR